MTISEMTDRELVEKILDGGEDLFGELVERYQGRLINYVARITRKREDSPDLVQEIFIKVYMALDRYDSKYNFSTWVFRIAQNAAIDVVRKKGLDETSLTVVDRDGGGERDMEIEADVVSPHRALSNKEMSVAMEEAINSLPDDYRDLIQLRHFAELSYEEIAQIRNLPLGTVKNKLFRARNVLKKELEGFLEPV